MAGEAQDAVWPLPKFYFKVTWGDKGEMTFQEVSGMGAEAQIIEYRHGNNPTFSTIKMPGIKKYGNITMKRGVFTGDNKNWDWFNEIKMNVIKRQTVTIQLLDEGGNTKMTWTCNNAWPTKVTSTDLKSTANEAAIDTLEIAYETLVIAAA